MASVLITGGTVTTASEQYVADVFLDDGVIVQIGANLQVAADTVVQAEGQYVIPGGIDVHTHLGETVFRTITADSWESGTVAAAFGGTTTVVDFARQEREGMSPIEAIEHRRRQAESQAVIDYGFHLMATNLDSQEYLEELAALPGEGVTSFKLLMAYPGTMMVDDLTIFRAMQVAADTNAIVTLHAENGHVIQQITDQFAAAGRVQEHMHMHAHPHLVEGEATHRGIAMAEMAGSAVYIVHLSSRTALTEVEAAKARGQAVYAETCPQYLFAAYEDYENAGFEAAKYICSPPIRERANQDELWRGIETGALSVIATDHCTFRMQDDLAELPPQKPMGKGDFRYIPNGVPGVENRMHLMYEGGVVEGRFDMMRFVDLNCTMPAKLFGLYPRKGIIAIGADADVVVWDPNADYTIEAATHHMRVDYNLYEGMKVSGRPSTVISRGEIIVSGEEFLGALGRGQYIRRSAPYVLDHPQSVTA